MNEEKDKKLKKFFGSKLQEHILMRDHTTIRIGGVADYFYEATKIEDLISSVIFVRENKIPYFILGCGSNILVSDYGFPGLVIHNNSSNISFLDKGQVMVDSGVKLSSLILKAIDKNLGGIESLYGIPGTIGGATYGNAGAYGMEIFDFIKSVTLLNPENKLVNYKNEWFLPEYRSTKLKRLEQKEYVILTVKFQLAHNKKEQLIDNVNKVKTERDAKFGSLGPSCGSVFKNPISNKEYKNIEMARKNSAGYLLDTIGVKKMIVGGAGIYSKHANIIENKNNASAADVKKLIENIKNEVRKQTGKIFEEEIEYIGQWE